MRYDTKIAIVVRDDLAPWQKLNVASFLSGGLVGSYPELPGERYEDASGQRYGPLIRQPILIFHAGEAEMRRTLQRALGRGVTPSIYTRDLFTTGNDADNRAAVRAVATEALDLVGIAVHAERKVTDKIVDGLKLHQ